MYGGVLFFPLLSGVFADKKKPDRYEVIGALTTLVGVFLCLIFRIESIKKRTGILLRETLTHRVNIGFITYFPSSSIALLLYLSSSLLQDLLYR